MPNKFDVLGLCNSLEQTKPILLANMASMFGSIQDIDFCGLTPRIKHQHKIKKPATTKNKSSTAKKTQFVTKINMGWGVSENRIYPPNGQNFIGNIGSASNLGLPAWAVAFRRAIP